MFIGHHIIMTSHGIVGVTCIIHDVLVSPSANLNSSIETIVTILHCMNLFLVEVTFILYFLIDSEDGRLSCGYSSFRGKRATMEDFYDIKASKIDGQSVCLFGIFDGQLLSYRPFS